MNPIKQLLYLLSSNELKRAVLILVITLFVGLLEITGIISILPFMTVLTNPDVIETNIYLKKIFLTSNIFGVKNYQQFMFFLGVIVFILLILSLSLKALLNYWQNRFVLLTEYSVSKRLIEAYLKQPYIWFLSKNSAEIKKNIFNEVHRVIAGGIKSLIELVAKTILTILIVTMLLIVDTKVTLMLGIILFSSYGLFIYFTKNYLKRLGAKSLENNKIRFLSINEAFGNFKMMKVKGLENYYIEDFNNASKNYGIIRSITNLISLLPRYILEILAFGGILLMILYKLSQSDDLSDVLPFVSLFLFAGYRLMPAIQQIYTSANEIIFQTSSIEKLYNEFKSTQIIHTKISKNKINFKNAIKLHNIDYNYPKSSQKVLKNINLTIPAKSIVGIIGPTGSGKTTLIDIILGLLRADKGSLEVDGKIIDDTCFRDWQNTIGYVPQEVYLSDDSIRNNIAFEMDKNEIDHLLVERVSKIAKLHQFIIEELPLKYDTVVGERGVKLSGGQRQRIAIARALYKNPEVLIFDEATSALDNETEKVIIDTLFDLQSKVTIIMVAHRLNTIKNCDLVFKLEKGRIVKQGSFEEVLKINNEEVIN